MLDYGARWYDPSIARWNAVDALAEHPNQVDKSVYAYAWNNPVTLNDPDGNCPTCPPTMESMAFNAGFFSGIKNALVGTYEAVTNPIQTIKGIAKLNTVEGQIQTAVAIGQGVQEFSEAPSITKWHTAGEVTGEIAVGIAAEKGMGAVGSLSKLSKLSKFDNIDDLANAFKASNLDNMPKNLSKNGWKKVEGDFGTREVYQKQNGKKKYYAQKETNTNHSKNTQPATYWKLTYGKINATKANTRRVSNDSNFIE